MKGDQNAALGVTRSLLGYRWHLKAGDARLAETLAQRAGLSPTLADILAARGLAAGSAEDYLNPTLRALLPDPSSLKDMDAAACLFADATERKESVAVYGDYDVDGATSAALLLRFARACGFPLRLYVPDRMKEGYGPNAPALRRLRAEGQGLILYVDCGTLAHEPLAAARAAGLPGIVLDHHTAEAALPPAEAIVNPNRLDDTSGQGALAAVGVTFLFCVAATRELRRRGFWSEARPEPDLRQWLDLVALGTVCDVVKLHGLNRAFVTQGLKVMAQGRNAGLRILSQVAGLQSPPDAGDLGFTLGPRINAGGRIGQSDLGARLLSGEDEAELTALALTLDRLNGERRAIEGEVLSAALAQLSAAERQGPMILVAGEGWHLGVLGIVAARLKERFHSPSLVVGFDGTGMGKGSGRSVKGFDLGLAVIAAKQAGLIHAGGGHEMAAGLTLSRDQWPAFCQFMQERLTQQLSAANSEKATPELPSASSPERTIDAVVSLAAATRDLAEELARMAPFGSGNAEPVLAFPDVTLLRAEQMGTNHLRLVLSQGGARLKAVAFRSLETPLGSWLLAHVGQKFHACGHLRINDWNGRKDIQLVIEDGAA